MSMTVVVAIDVPDRYHGFLASALCEIATSVYVSAGLSIAVRDRIWSVLSEWYAAAPQGQITMVWVASKADGRIGLLQLGEHPRDLCWQQSTLLARLPLLPADRRTLNL